MLYFLLCIFILSCYNSLQRPGVHYAIWTEIFNLCCWLAVQMCTVLKAWWLVTFEDGRVQCVQYNVGT